MSTLEFSPFPKIARLNRDITISEKLDGTNAAVVIVETDFNNPNGESYDPQCVAAVETNDGNAFAVFAQSRTRFVTSGKNDNYGFAGWVQRNAEALVATLGEGTHFGEWWGAGIQRKYGLTGGDKRFSLFNTKRWYDRFDHGDLYLREASGIPELRTVPVLYEGPFNQYAIDVAQQRLRVDGSVAVPGFQRPEGIVIFHHASRDMFKVTLEGDEAPKGAAAHAHDEERIAA